MKKVRKQNKQVAKSENTFLLAAPEEQPAEVDAKRVLACPSLAHLSEAEAEEFAAFIRLYCEAVYRLVEKMETGGKENGASFDWEHKNAA